MIVRQSFKGQEFPQGIILAVYILVNVFSDASMLQVKGYMVS